MSWLRSLWALWLAYWKGEQAQKVKDDEQSLKDAAQARKIDDSVRDLTDAELDDELRHPGR